MMHDSVCHKMADVAGGSLKVEEKCCREKSEKPGRLNRFVKAKVKKVCRHARNLLSCDHKGGHVDFSGFDAVSAPSRVGP